MNLRILAICLFTSLPALPVTAHEGHEHDGEHDHSHQHDGDHSRPDHVQDDAAALFTTRPPARDVPLPDAGDAFHFVVFGDRTGGPPEGIAVLKDAVADTNLIDPDLVMTVGDLIQGYNMTPNWMKEMREYRQVMSQLRMNWFPVAGNHDVYWRGEGEKPDGEHEANYEKHFGPLWYTFAHKNAGFIALYSDEGDRETNRKGFNRGDLQMMSEEQLEFLSRALERHAHRDHVFVFLHHPRWIGGGYEGSNWDVVEKMLLDAGNVTAVFAGHIHRVRYQTSRGQTAGGKKIQYFTLATVGGHLNGDIPGAGLLHHFNLVTVRPTGISVAAIPVGGVIDPKEFTPAFLADIDRVRQIRAVPVGDSHVTLNTDGSANGEVAMELSNPSPMPVRATIRFEGAADGWTSSLDHGHIELPPGGSRIVEAEFRRGAGLDSFTAAAVVVDLEAIGDSTRIALPPVSTPVPIRFDALPADLFPAATDRFLRVSGVDSAVRIDSDEIEFDGDPLTLEAWVRPRVTSGFNAIIAKTQNSGYSLFFDEGVPQVSVRVGDRYINAEGRQPLPTDRWSHLAGVYDGDAVSLFIDGKRIDSRPAPDAPRSRNGLPLYIGADPGRDGGPSRPFDGDIDEVRLSAAAVYEEDFTPAVRMTPRDDTVMLMHLDQTIGPFVISEGPRPVKGFLGDAAALVEK